MGEEAVSSPVQSLPEFLAARNSLVVDCGLTGESLPLLPDSACIFIASSVKML